MKINISKANIPPWISCHTYNYETENSRTYISNEKRHEYIQLDGLSSDIWKMIYDKKDNNVFFQWINEKGLNEQIDDFLEELQNKKLLCFSNIAEGHFDNNVIYEDTLSEDDNSEDKFLNDMKNWFFDNGFLFSLFFELTYKCNLNCIHCYNPKDMASIEIDFEKCKQIIDEAYDLGCFKMIFSGGEATLHSRFLDIIKYARSKHISVEIFTNGQRMYDDITLYKNILSLYPYRVCISLYSTDKVSHENVTSVKGSFEKTFLLIQKLRKDGVNVQIKNFLLNVNCRDCIKVKDMAKSIRATSVADLSLIPTIEGDKKTFQYMVNENELFELYSNPDSPLYVGKNYVKNDIKKTKEDSPCWGGFTGVTINPKLEVSICVSMPLSLGNLKNESLTDIWQKAYNKKPESKLYQWRSLKRKDFTECFNHDYCAFCDFCPGMGYLENGFLKKSDVLCMQAKAKMKAYLLANKKIKQ